MTLTEAAAPAEVASPPSRPVDSAGDGLSRVFIAVFGLFGWTFGLHQLSDNSYFWHVRTGGVILDSGVPHHDIYSFTIAGHTWIAQSWLAELLYGVINRQFGGHGLQILSAATGALLGMLMMWTALRITGERVRALGVTALASAVIFLLWSERPLAFGLLALALVVIVIELPKTWMGRHPLIVLPAVFWVWGNVHGTWFLGMAYVGFVVLAGWFDGRPWWKPGRERTLVLAVLLSAAVLVLNPYGVAMLTFPIELVGRGGILQNVVEWRSPNFRELTSAVYGLWLVLFVVVGVRSTRRYSRRDLIVAVPFLALAFWAQRNVALAVLVTLPIVARACRPLEHDLPVPSANGASGTTTTATSTVAPDRTARVSRVALVALVALGGVWLVGTYQRPAFDYSKYPVKSLARLDRTGQLGPHTRLLTTDDWAGYVIAKYWPKQPVFFDDRYDTYPVAQSQEYLTLNRGGPGWQSVLDRNHLDLVVWPKNAPLTQLLAESPRWERERGDHLSAVFKRRQ